MAALTGVMTADFTQFTTEIDRSVLKLQELETAAGPQGASGAMGGFSDGLRQVDSSLGLVGIKIGPQIRALEELGNVAGLTFEKLGLFGSVGAIFATGAAAFQLTTWALEWTTLDESISDATAALLGWGDIAGQEAGAKMDTLRLATQYAGYEVRLMDEALRVIKEHNKEVSDSFNTGAERVRQWGADIAKIRASGDLPQIEKDLKEGIFTLKEIATKYNVSTRALEYYIERKKGSMAVLDEWRKHEAEALEKVKEAHLELNMAGDGWRNTLATIAPATAAAVTAYLAMDASQGALATAYGLTTQQVKALNLALQEQTATLIRNEPALGTLDAFMKSLPPEITKAGESTMFFDQQLIASIATVSEQAVPELEKLEGTFRSVTEAARELTAETSKNAPGSVGVNTGGISFGGIDVETAMKNYTARYGSGSSVGAVGGRAPDFLTWAMSMGYASKGATVTNTFNITDTESGIARRVSEEIGRQVNRGSLVS